jgi:hypothetical protein
VLRLLVWALELDLAGLNLLMLYLDQLVELELLVLAQLPLELAHLLFPVFQTLPLV